MITTNIGALVFLFNIFKGTNFHLKLLPQSFRAIKHDSKLMILALSLNFIYKVCERAYKYARSKLLLQYSSLPKEKWKNNYPIVLIHGFSGFMPDESILMGNYFAYASDPKVAGDHLIYAADVSPFGSLHDRSCELYQ